MTRRTSTAGSTVERAAGRVGGGALPLLELEGPVVTVRPNGVGLDRIQAGLRANDPPVIARVQKGVLVLDPRTIGDDQVEPAAAGCRRGASLSVRPLTLGTAGHIDHGKTVLVEALTGVNTDRLPEEQARGISIELGFASLELPSGRALSVVDVPGHERFVRTMVAGATGVDLFLLVIAADDGVMPQTREHLAILELLEVPAGVVGITKTDLVGADGVDLVVDQVRELLADGPYEQAPIVPVCAPAGEHLDELVAALDGLRRRLPGRARAGGELRLHVDRSFSLKGIGTVVTGTLWSGVLQVGDEVRIEPSERTARVRSIEVHGNRRERADAGQRVAANLAGLDRREVERGDVLVTPGSSLEPAYIVDAAVELLPGTRPLARGTRVHVHHGNALNRGAVGADRKRRPRAGQAAVCPAATRTAGTTGRR